MKKMRIVHLAVLLAFMLAASLQPANGQTTETATSPAESSPALESPSNVTDGGEISPLTISLAGGPDYDSSWVPVPQGQTVTLTHNLGGSNTDNYWVALDFKSSDQNIGINQIYYGGADISATGGQVGAYWQKLTTTTVSVTRRANDPYAEKVRVRIWTDPAQNLYKYKDHIVRGSHMDYTSIVVDADNYLVDLRFIDANPGGYGINQRFYGAKDCLSDATDCQASTRQGLTWFNLATNQAAVFRTDEDTSCAPEANSFFLTKTWMLPKPTYSSGWQPIDVGSDLPLTHSVGGNAEDYLVDLEFKSSNNDIGINHLYYGGARLGAHDPRTFPEYG